MEFLKSFDLSLWWRALIAVGVVIVGAALAAKDRGVLIVGFGLIAFGFGEWLNRPKLGQDVGGGMYKTWYGRVPCISGLTLDAIGLILIAYGAWKILVT